MRGALGPPGYGGGGSLDMLARISVQGIWLDAELPSQLLKGNFVLRKKQKKGDVNLLQFLWKHVVCYTCVLRAEQNAI